jgi:ferric-dicitrate binding protein FerR (iron transport regulator)
MTRRYGAAAAILAGLLGIGGFILWRTSSHKQEVPAFVSIYHNDIDPGRDRATLTFADGSRVALDGVGDYNRLQNGRAKEGGNVGSAGGNGGNGRDAGGNAVEDGRNGGEGRGNGWEGRGNGGEDGRNGGDGRDAGGNGAEDGRNGWDAGKDGRNENARSRRPALYRLLATPAAGQYRLTLADGTRVWLNSQSSIRFPTTFDGKTRLVEVTGEAYFDVAKDARRPFVVKAGKLIIQALGTRFNVYVYADEPAAKATLIQGSVRVIEGTDSLLLTPGQEGEANEFTGPTGKSAGNSGKSGNTGKSAASGGKSGSNGSSSGSSGSNGSSDVLALNNAVDTAQASAWKDGYFDFDNQDILAIMRQFERWYDIRVVFAAKPSITLFAGRLQRSLRLSQVMIGLGRMGVHSRLEGRTLTILP